MDREKVIGLLQKIAEYFRECRSNASFASKAENHFWELQNAANEAIDLLEEQKELINNLEQEIRDKNKRLKERAQQVDTMLKERDAVEPIAIKREMFDEYYGAVACCPKCDCMWIMYMDNDMHYCPECGQAVKWE